MPFQILYGEDFTPGFLEKVFELDSIVFESQYVGELQNMQARYERNPQCFVCLMDGERLVGYNSFFPVTQALWEEIIRTGEVMRDDDIRPDEMADYIRGEAAENRLFGISVAIHPDYRDDKKSIIALTDAWIGYLNRLRREGYPITAIAATAVSPDGVKFMRSRHFRFVRKLKDGNQVFVCDGEQLEKLLAGEHML